MRLVCIIDGVDLPSGGEVIVVCTIGGRNTVLLESITDDNVTITPFQGVQMSGSIDMDFEELNITNDTVHLISYSRYTNVTTQQLTFYTTNITMEDTYVI